MDINDIRYKNARAILREFALKENITRGEGISAFAKVLDKQQGYVSGIMGEKPTRPIGNKVAKQIEDSFGKPRGWLDHLHDAPESDKKQAIPADSFQVPVVGDTSTGPSLDWLAGGCPAIWGDEYSIYISAHSDAYCLRITEDLGVYTNAKGMQLAFSKDMGVVCSPNKPLALNMPLILKTNKALEAKLLILIEQTDERLIAVDLRAQDTEISIKTESIDYAHAVEGIIFPDSILRREK